MRGWLVLLALVLVGCGDGGVDAGARNACREFREIAADAQAGVLMDAEMASRSRDVFEKAQASDDDELVIAAAALARDVGDPSSGVIGRMGDACDERDL